MEKKETVVSKEELRQMLSKQIQEQVVGCQKELNEAHEKILNKYQCKLEISMTLTPRGNVPNIAVVPRRE